MHSVLVATLGRTQVRMHPLLLVVLAGACVLGRLNELLQAMLAIALHEAAHAAAAAAFGCRIHSIELHPFGGIARLDARGISPDAEWCIAAAGPAMSFIASGVSALTCYISPLAGARMEPFLSFNLTLAAVNLLPALPLDGGRIVRHILREKANASFAHRATAWAGVAIGAGMLVLAGVAAHLKIPNLTLPVIGGFLLLTSAGEIRYAPDKRLAALWQKESVLLNGGMDVHCVAAHSSMIASEALRLIRANRYTYIRIVDTRMRLLGELGETALLTGMVEYGGEIAIGELLHKKGMQKR